MQTNSLSIKCENINLKLGDTKVFQDFDFEFFGPGIVFIEGDNGVGKSSLLKIIAGFITPKSGKVTFGDRRIKDFRVTERSYLTTSSIGLLNDITGLDHIYMIAKIHNLNEELINREIEKFSELAIFEKILSKNVSDYSQGMKQLLRIFLHLFFKPKIVFLDEPFLYLSPKVKSFIENYIESLSRDSLIFITDQSCLWKPITNNVLIRLGEI